MMKNTSFQRMLRTWLPILFVVTLYAALIGVEALFGVSPWVTRPLFVVFVASFPVYYFLKIANLRERTERALAGHQQIVDEPLDVETPSGALVLTDLSTLRAWRPSAEFGEELIDKASSDLTLSGPKSWEVARRLGLSTPYLYDIPQPALVDILKHFDTEASKLAAKVSVDVEPSRIPHVQRAERANEQGPALFNIRDRKLLSIPAEKASLVRSWLVDGSVDTVDLYISKKDVVTNKLVGEVKFHSNALVAADARALEEWDSFESRDGLYDLVLIGASAELAQEAGGERVQGNVWRWSNVSLTDAERVAAMMAMRDPAAHLAVNPHGDEYFLTAQLALDPTGQRIFPEGTVTALRLRNRDSAIVSAGLDLDGNLVRVRLSFGTDPAEVFFLPPATRLEKLLVSAATKLPRLRRKSATSKA